MPIDVPPQGPLKVQGPASNQQSRFESWLDEVVKSRLAEGRPNEMGTEADEASQVRFIIKTCALIGAALSMQPLPIADFFILTPLEIIMVRRIGEIKGFPLSPERAKEVVGEVAGVIGMAKAAQLFVLSLYKLVPGFGSLAAAATVYGLIYGMGRVFEAYFDAKRKGQTLTASEMSRTFDQSRQAGRREYEAERPKNEGIHPPPDL